MSRPHIELVQSGDIVVARLEGEIDFSDAGRVSSELLAATPNDTEGLILDLSGTRYIDSAGIRMLFDLARRLHICRQRLGIALPDSSPVRRLVQITKLDEVVTVSPSVEECEHALMHVDNSNAGEPVVSG